MTMSKGTDYIQANETFNTYLKARRRSLITELRDIEKHLLQCGIIHESALKPPKSKR